jgi:hypothetical protein
MDAEQSPSFLEELWAGLSTPSLGSCLGALGFVVFEIALCCVFLTPERIATIDAKILMEGPADDYGRITVTALRLHYAQMRGLNVAYLGASSARQALLHSESPGLIQDYLTAQLGERTTFHFLSADAESIVDAISLSEQLPDGYRGVVVFVVSDYRDEERERFFQQRDRLRAGSRLALYAPEGDRAAAAQDQTVRPRTGIYFLDFFQFFAMRRVAAARIYRSLPKPPMQGAPTLITPAQQAAFARRMAPTWERVRVDLATRQRKLAILNEDRPVLEALVATWKKKHLTGILLEAPDNPKYDEMKQGMRELYRAEMPRVAAEIGVEYWDLNPEVGLAASDFYDHVHLMDQGARFKFQAAFVRRLAAFMKPMALPAPVPAESPGG